MNAQKRAIFEQKHMVPCYVDVARFSVRAALHAPFSKFMCPLLNPHGPF